MSSKLLQSKNNRQALAFALLGAGAIGAVGSLSFTTANADELGVDQGSAMTLAKGVTAGSFDLTKQATGDLTFPLQFDRPSGVNAAALAGTVTQLGASSDLYKSAVAAVPELSNTAKMNSLLGDSLDDTNPNYASARATIVKLINWYNSLGGQQITTQAGAAYTVDNLDAPINVLAVAFSNNNSINTKATASLAALNNAKTVSDVMKALESYKAGVSLPYTQAFQAYADKVYADGANLNALSQYTAVKPVLDTYESMYANGAAAIRTTLLNGEATSTEAGVTFFESAVLAGPSSDGGGDGSDSNIPKPDVKYTTKWVDESGNALAVPETSDTGYGSQKTIDGYTYKSVSTDDSTNTKTYVYKKTPVATTADTVWVDDKGNALKPKEDGTFPDDGKTTLFPGYVIISTDTTTDASGNKHTVNTYHKTTADTVWVDESGNTLKPKAEGEFPDSDGVSDIDGYELVSVNTKTDENGDRHIINTYKKKPVTPTPTPDNKHTTWVDKDGNTLKPKADGNHPDVEGDDIPGYKFIETVTDKDGNTINRYEKIKEVAKVDTYWFDTEGETLKPKVEGTFPDNDGVSDIKGYKLVQTYPVTDKDVAEGGVFHEAGVKAGDTINIYEKIADAKVVTTWVDMAGNTLKDKAEGAFPDKEGDDIPGYTLVSVETDSDGNVKNTYMKTPEADKVITKWVDEAGKKLKEPVDGAFPDNDGKSDIPGYELVRTDVDAAGNVTNVYKAVTKEVTTSWVDKTTGKPLSDDEIGKAFGNAKDFDKYTLVDVKTSEDGTHKTYYYEPDAKPAPTPTPAPTPKEDTPATPTPTPVDKVLPKAGMEDGLSAVATLAGSGIFGALGLKGLGKRRRSDKK